MGIVSTAPAAVADGSEAGVGRSWSLKVYVVGLVVLFVAAAGANVVYQRRAAADVARQAAAADAAFGAGIAARDIAADIGLVRTTVATTAANPGIPQIFAAPAGCTLSFGGAGDFRTGHVDIVGREGTANGQWTCRPSRPTVARSSRCSSTSRSTPATPCPRAAP